MSKVYKSGSDFHNKVLSYKDDHIFNSCSFEQVIIHFDAEQVVFNNCFFNNGVHLKFNGDKKGTIIINNPILSTNTNMDFRSSKLEIHNNKEEISKIKIEAETIILVNTSINQLHISGAKEIKVLDSNIVVLEANPEAIYNILNSYVNNDYFGMPEQHQNIIKKSS
jgi:hypothetical protein